MAKSNNQFDLGKRLLSETERSAILDAELAAYLDGGWSLESRGPQAAVVVSDMQKPHYALPLLAIALGACSFFLWVAFIWDAWWGAPRWRPRLFSYRVTLAVDEHGSITREKQRLITRGDSGDVGKLSGSDRLFVVSVIIIATVVGVIAGILILDALVKLF